LNQQIALLVRLQKIAFAIREYTQRKEAGPNRLQALEDQFQATLEDIGAARLRYETLESERRQLEAEVQDLEAKLEKYHQQLMSVTNAREYSAALNEIDAAKTARDRAEEGILARKIEEEELADAVAEADTRIAKARSHTDAEKSTLVTELSEVDARLDALAREQAEVEGALDTALVSQFRRVFAARGGVAMARIINAACSACNLRLRPQVINEVRKGDELVPCDSCRRFLFIDDEENGATEGEPVSSDSPDQAPPSSPAPGEPGASLVADGPVESPPTGNDSVQAS
jgi:predicted  nucleic acid-binding Zn-ribbon protein